MGEIMEFGQWSGKPHLCSTSLKKVSNSWANTEWVLYFSSILCGIATPLGLLVSGSSCIQMRQFKDGLGGSASSMFSGRTFDFGWYPGIGKSPLEKESVSSDNTVASIHS